MIPRDCMYTKEHEWLRIEEEMGVVGITAYAQEKLGDVVYLELPVVGKQVLQLKPFGVVESVKAASDLYSPLSGRVTEVNSQLREHPEWVNQDPYGQGWMIKIRANDLKEADNLLSPDEYEALISGEEAG